MIGYSFLKTTSTRKKLNTPLPNPTNRQSINPASLEVNATPIAVATAIKIYMSHLSFSFIPQFNTVKSIFVAIGSAGLWLFVLGLKDSRSN